MTLKEYSDHVEFITEHELTQEPLRIDVVMIKKLDDIVIEKSNPNDLMEVYKSMGMARLTDENMEFLIEAKEILE